MNANFDLQPLEPRRLLSGLTKIGAGTLTLTGTNNYTATTTINGGTLQLQPLRGIAADPEVAAAQQAVRDAAAKLRSDTRTGHAKLLQDKIAIRAQLKELAEEIGQDAIDEAIAPLKEKLAEDQAASREELHADYKALHTELQEWEALLREDMADIRAARQAGDEDALEAAKQSFADHKAEAKVALKPFRDEIAADQEKWRAIIKADHQAIIDALIELDPDLEPLYDKLEADRVALEATLKADREALAEAIEDLREAIKAYREDHPPTT
jgi:autotransporter-associated beta strand protein